MQQFNIADFLPQPPWLGPPLPRFLSIAWPWLQGGNQSSLPALLPRNYISSIIEEEQKETSIVPHQPPLATYQNEESWEIEWSDEGLPTKVVVTRHATRG